MCASEKAPASLETQLEKESLPILGGNMPSPKSRRNGNTSSWKLSEDIQEFNGASAAETCELPS